MVVIIVVLKVWNYFFRAFEMDSHCVHKKVKIQIFYLMRVLIIYSKVGYLKKWSGPHFLYARKNKKFKVSTLRDCKKLIWNGNWFKKYSTFDV